MDEGALTRRTLVAGIGVAGLSASAASAQAPSAPGALTTAPASQMGLSPRLTMHAIDNFHGTPGSCTTYRGS